MTNWMLRGLVFGAAMVVVRLFQGTLISVWQTQAALISIVLLVLFVVGVVAWGFIDGREDAASNPDPDRREDLAMTWLLAGLVAGLLSGAVTWLIAVFYKALYVGGLINELTTFAAFTALVVFLGAISGVAVGRWRVDKKGDYKPQSGTRDGEEDRADTDVFAAVRSGQAHGDGAVEEWPEEQTSAVATAERDHDAPTAYSEEAAETTESHAAPSEAKTAEVPASQHSEPATEHIEKPKTD
ncbi:B-4DMT family transporter [Mycobacterium paraterrae]|uniref:B-4DMT family transporter n=1 Tax=Mycobacterium paraterrae TaxID=577492 RepID=A0ABY3VGE9_9MYCO|nr:B-4DMT family transporter [Mycobacterium paraterrae]UMB67690.1 B-4DMT family transporter [Mycobacterium paraterrae]